MKRRFPLLFLGFAALLSACAAPRRSRDRAPAGSVASTPGEDRATKAAADGEPPIVRVNRTLIYPVRNGRAEDLAVTLAPLLEAMYGPGARVLPQVGSNKLLIYIPPREERLAAQGQPGASPQGTVRRDATPPPAGTPPAGTSSRRGRTLRR